MNKVTTTIAGHKTNGILAILAAALVKQYVDIDEATTADTVEIVKQVGVLGMIGTLKDWATRIFGGK